jgi:hypothetical protein
VRDKTTLDEPAKKLRQRATQSSFTYTTYKKGIGSVQPKGGKLYQSSTLGHHSDKA